MQIKIIISNFCMISTADTDCTFVHMQSLPKYIGINIIVVKVCNIQMRTIITDTGHLSCDSRSKFTNLC